MGATFCEAHFCAVTTVLSKDYSMELAILDSQPAGGWVLRQEEVR